MALWLIALLQISDIYRYVDDRGVVHFTNLRPRGKKWELVVREYSKGRRTRSASGRCRTCDVIPARDRSPDRFTRYDTYIFEASRLYRVPVALIKAVIKVESDFDPRVVSYKGAQGLMQLMPSVQQDLGVRNPFDPRENILAGTRLLRMLANMFGGDMVLTVAAYHAGPGAVRRYGGVPPYKSTRRYVRMVIRAYYRYRNRGY